jgi:hypothetical protein
MGNFAGNPWIGLEKSRETEYNRKKIPEDLL